GNLLIVVSMAIDPHRQLKSSFNYFVVNLAFADLIIGCVTEPAFIGFHIRHPLLFLGYWPFPDLVCQFYGFCIVDCAIASLLLVAATAVNRYFKVVRTNYYRNLFTPRRTKLLICGCWLLAALVPTLFLVRGERYHFHPAKILCVQQNRQEGVLTWYVLTWYVYIIVAMCTIVTSYYKIFRTIRRHQTRVNCMQQNTTGPNIQDIKVTRTLFLTVVAFLVCWIPILIIDNIDDSLGLFSLPREVYLFYSWIGAFSSVINPFIYGAMNPAFREEYKKIL
ncbi:predicted protein, partial [Nematostella vectensis]